MILWPWVTRRELDDVRAQRDRLQTAYDRLVRDVVSMKRRGFELPHQAKVKPPEEPEHAAVRRAENSVLRKAFIERAIADIQRRNPGVEAHIARAEAERLYEDAHAQQPT